MSLKPPSSKLESAAQYFNYGPNDTDRHLLSMVRVIYFTSRRELRPYRIKQLADDYFAGVTRVNDYPTTNYGADLLNGLQQDDLTRAGWELQFNLNWRSPAGNLFTFTVQGPDGTPLGTMKLSDEEATDFMAAGFFLTQPGFVLPDPQPDPEPAVEPAPTPRSSITTSAAPPPLSPQESAEWAAAQRRAAEIANGGPSATTAGGSTSTTPSSAPEGVTAKEYIPTQEGWWHPASGTVVPWEVLNLYGFETPHAFQPNKGIGRFGTQSAFQENQLMMVGPVGGAGALAVIGRLATRLAALGRNPAFWTGVGTAGKAIGRFLFQSSSAAGKAALRNPTLAVGAGVGTVLATTEWPDLVKFAEEHALEVAAVATVGGLAYMHASGTGDEMRRTANSRAWYRPKSEQKRAPRAGADAAAQLAGELSRYRVALDAEPNSTEAYCLAEQFELPLLKEPAAHQALIDHAPALVSIKGPPDWQPFHFWTPDGIIIDDSLVKHDASSLVRDWLRGDHSAPTPYSTTCSTCMDASMRDPLMRKLDAPVPRRARFFNSGMVTAELDDMPRGVYGEIDFDVMPYRIRINRSAVNSRIRLAYVHEMVHAIDEQAKLGISHDQVHHLAMFILNEMLPGYLALDTHLAGELNNTQTS